MAAIGTLFLLIVLSLLAVIVTVILPARSSIYKVEPRLALLGSAYFLLIGLGFMFIEIGLIQRISVFMGHPIYALSVVLFSVILSTGLGSLLSEKLMPTRPLGVLFWLSLLVIYLLALPSLAAPIDAFRARIRRIDQSLPCQRRGDSACRHPYGIWLSIWHEGW